MKKIFTLLAGAVMTLSASAQTVIYEWSSTGEDAVTEVGGKATHENLTTTTNRVNYANSGYYTICLSGKKGNLGDTGMSKDEGSYIQIALEKAITTGDELILTGYITKNSATVGNAYVRFVDANGEKLAEVSEANDVSYPNIHPDVDKDGTAKPESHKIIVPEGVTDCKTIWMSRSKTGTNVFLTKVQVVSNQAGGQEPTPAVVPVPEYTLDTTTIPNAKLAILTPAEGTTSYYCFEPYVSGGMSSPAQNPIEVDGRTFGTTMSNALVANFVMIQKDGILYYMAVDNTTGAHSEIKTVQFGEPVVELPEPTVTLAAPTVTINGTPVNATEEFTEGATKMLMFTTTPAGCVIYTNISYYPLPSGGIPGTSVISGSDNMTVDGKTFIPATQIGNIYTYELKYGGLLSFFAYDKTNNTRSEVQTIDFRYPGMEEPTPAGESEVFKLETSAEPPVELGTSSYVVSENEGVYTIKNFLGGDDLVFNLESKDPGNAAVYSYYVNFTSGVSELADASKSGFYYQFDGLGENYATFQKDGKDVIRAKNIYLGRGDKGCSWTSSSATITPGANETTVTEITIGLMADWETYDDATQAWVANPTYRTLYNLTVTLGGDQSGIQDIYVEEVDENAPVEYYNLQGVRINEPAAGQVVIRRQGNKAVKMIVR